MKCSTVLLVGILLLLLSVPGAAQFVQDSDDLGAADTIGIEFVTLPDAAGGQMNVQADLWVFSDANDIGGMTAGFMWPDNDMEMDSAVASALTLSTLDYAQFFYYHSDIAATNLYRWFLFGGVRMSGTGLLASPGRKVLASYYFTMSDWSATDSVVIDSALFDSGSKLTFVNTGTFEEYRPYREIRWVGYDTPAGCCVQRVGDADGQGGDEPTIGDLSVIVDALFISGYCDGIIACLAEADINLSGGADPNCEDITIGDYSILMDYLFITGPSLGLDDCY